MSMTNKPLELRTSVSLSEREETSEGLIVRGLVNKPGEWSQPLPAKNGGTFIERVMPKVFSQAINRNANIKFLDRHNQDKILASTKNGTLTLEETDEGLFMEARIAPTSYGKDAYELIKAGEMAQMSFGMAVLNEDWEIVNGTARRSITDLYLGEISCVPDPAYIQSKIEARSIEVEQIEVPEIEERNYNDETDIVKLEAIKQEILNEGLRALETAESEKRNLTPAEELRQVAIQNELSKIKTRIVELNSKTNTKVENKMENILEKRQGVEDFIKGVESEERAMLAGSGSGALTIPTEMESEVIEKIEEVADLFSRTDKHNPVDGKLELLVEEDIKGAVWVGENQAVTAQDVEVGKVTLEQKRVGSAIELTKHLINQSGIDIVAYSQKVLSKRIGRAIDRAVINGNPVNDEFQGILNAGLTAEVTATSATAIDIDELLELSLSMPKEFLDGAVFIVSRKTFNTFAKSFKDADGNYQLVKDVVNGKPTYKLLGQEILVSDVMPEMIAGAQAVIFANLGEGYATMVQQGIELSRIADKQDMLNGVVTIMIDSYMDGKVKNKQAIKVLKMAAV